MATAWRDDCVFRTAFVRRVWVDAGTQPSAEWQLVSLSTAVQRALGSAGTCRQVPAETAAIVDAD